MSFKIPEGLKKGDTVEILLRGEVTEVGSHGDWFDLDGEFSFYQESTAALVVSVEKVTPPLPTTPGSVIVERGTSRSFLLVDGGFWFSQGAVSYPLASIASKDFEVIHDAGKTS